MSKGGVFLHEVSRLCPGEHRLDIHYCRARNNLLLMSVKWRKKGIIQYECSVKVDRLYKMQTTLGLDPVICPYLFTLLPLFFVSTSVIFSVCNAFFFPVLMSAKPDLR